MYTWGQGYPQSCQDHTGLLHIFFMRDERQNSSLKTYLKTDAQGRQFSKVDILL